MVEIEFDLNQESIVVQANLTDIFQVAIDSYTKKSLLDPNSIYFLANGRQINPNETIESQMSNINKANKRMKVLVQFLKKDAIVEASKTRLRPVLMTALTTIISMSTMAMGMGQGTEMSQPMAIVVVGGMIYGTLLTLVVVPCIYDALNRERDMREEDLDLPETVEVNEFEEADEEED